MKITKSLIPEEVVLSKIYLIRDLKVMLDRDLAILYGVETKQLKRQVRRNIARFPKDFMFELTKEELKDWRRQFGTSNAVKIGLRYPPFAFTEQGVAMLSSVLNSESAISVNIQIMRAFTKMRLLLMTNKNLRLRMDEFEKKLSEKDGEIKLIFRYIKQLLEGKEVEKDLKERRRIGFKTPKD